MDDTTLNNILIFDQLNEGYDWFVIVKGENNIEIANRIKATSTRDLKHIIHENNQDDLLTVDFARKEMIYRITGGNIDENGNIAFSEKFESMKALTEVLSAEDPVEKWIADFIKSDDKRFDGKSKKERINMALGAYYGAKNQKESLQEKRNQRIVSIATKSNEENLIRFYIESLIEHNEELPNAILSINESFKKFVHDLTEETISAGSEGHVKCISSWGACTVGKVYSGIWMKGGLNALRLDLRGLPGATSHPGIFYYTNTRKLSISKQFELL